MRHRLAGSFVLVALVVHAFAMGAAWRAVRDTPNGRDYASYHYAARVAWEGGDPYDTEALGRLARAEGSRRAVHPFFYPPPFLLGMAWSLPVSLQAGYRTFFFLNELFLAGVVLVLWAWWRPLGVAVPVVLAATVAALTAIPDNATMGQANLPVVFLVVAGLAAEDRGRSRLGGALLGAACMAKMAPALLVLWWLWRGRWRAAAWACVAGVALSIAALAVSPPAATWRFYTDVLPRFGSGDYNGLTVPIGLFANHSLPNLWWQAFGGGPHHLSAAARLASTLTTGSLVAGLALAFRGPPRDLLGVAGQVSAVIVVMLLTPVYCYEHHLVWAILPIAALGLAWWTGRLGRAWVWLVVPAAAVCVELSWLTEWAQASPRALRWLLQESKTFGLVGLLTGAVALGWRPSVSGYAGRVPGEGR